jgi:AcrR family transcriptional regulator
MEKKRSTKERILETTLRLFNQDGVERVTTSHIAKEMGMSLGNLHYHFPNRNELIRALINGFVVEVELLIAQLFPSEAVGLLEYMFKIQFMSFRLLWEYRFLFNDRLVIKRRMDDLEVRFALMIETRGAEFKTIMAELRESGLLRSDIPDEVLHAYFQQIIISNNSWVSYDHLFPHEGVTYEYFAEQAILNWQPFLTCTQEELRAAIKEARAAVRNLEFS